MNSIFQMFSPMSPNPMDHEIEQLEIQLEYKVKIIEDLEKQEEAEMEKYSKIMDAKDRQSRSRKRQRSECSGCPAKLKNSCLECKQESTSKKLKNIHDHQNKIKQEIADIKTKKNSRQEVRELRRPAEIYEEARRKEIEAAQQEADDLKTEPMDEDFPTESATGATNAGEELNNQSDVKTEPSESHFSIGMPNQVKTEPAEDSPLVNNDVFMNADSSLSPSDEDMDSEPANEATNNDAPQVNEAPNLDADNELPWWYPYENELEAIIFSF